MSRFPSQQEPPRFRPPKRNQLWFRILAGTIGMSAAVILILPFTQALTAGNKDRNIFQVQSVTIPPPEPPPPEPPPPPEEEEEQEQPELDEPPPMMDISALESMLNPGMGGVGVGGIDFGSMQGKATVEEAIFFSLKDLDRRPQLVSGGPEDIRREFPTDYLQRRIKADVRVKIQVDPRGSVSVLEVEGTNDPVIIDAIRRGMSRWSFTPPTINGEPVTIRYIQPFPIDLGG